MFFEVFAASALATLIFGGNKPNKPEKDYTHEFERLHDRFDKVENTLQKINTDTSFLRARECLSEFSPKLLGEPKLSAKCCTLIDIQKAALEGFNLLLETAMADEDNFLDARKKFNETYGNIEWLKEKYGGKCEEFEIFAKRMESDIRVYKETFRCHTNAFIRLWNRLVKVTPLKNAWFYTRKEKIFMKKCKPLLVEFFKTHHLPEKYFSEEFASDYLAYTGNKFDMLLDARRQTYYDLARHYLYVCVYYNSYNKCMVEHWIYLVMRSIIDCAHYAKV